MRTLASLTPIRVEADSRAYKIAASAARLGWRSVLVEGEGSRALDRAALPFELRGPHPVEGAPAPLAPEDRGRPTRPAGRLDPVLRAPVRIARQLLADGPRTRRLVPAAAVAYLHSFQQLPALWTRHGLVPFVYDAHDFYSVLADPAKLDPAGRAAWRFDRRLERLAARRAAAVVTVSTGVAALIEERFGRSPLVLSNAHDPRLDAAGGPGVREALGAGPGDLVIAVTGNRKASARIDTIIAALGLLGPHVRLALIGAGYDALAGGAGRAGLGDRVRAIAPVLPTEIVPFIRGADLAIVPYEPLNANLESALPNGFFHATAAGLPILHGDLPEVAARVAQHGMGERVDLRSPEAFAAALRALDDDRAGLATLAAAAATAAEQLSWEVEEPALGDLLERVAAGERLP